MKKQIDISTWARRPQFEHFNKFDDPFYGINVEIDCTLAYKKAKDLGVSFFLYYLHKSLIASNTVEAFRLRIENGKVYLYDYNYSAITVDRPDNTFGFGNIEFTPNFEEFCKAGEEEVKRVRSEKALEPSELDNVIHYSVAPWINFTALSHPRCFSAADSCPKITFGKLTQKGEQKIMPMAVHVSHALVDGRDIGAYIDAFQQLMNQ